MSIAHRVFLASDAASKLEALILESEVNGGDVTGLEDQIDCLASQSADLAPAIDDLLSIVSEIEMRADARKAESKRIADLAKRDQAVMDWLRGQVARVMEQAGKDKMETPRHKITLAVPGGVRALEIMGDVPAEYTSEVVTVVPNKDKIRSALESGQQLPFAMLHSKQKVLRIK